jgi:biotin synthase
VIELSASDADVIESAVSTVIHSSRSLSRPELDRLGRVGADAVRHLLDGANRVREHFCGSRAAVEVLFNAKRGGCSEDCHFCSQSARFASDVEPEPAAALEDFVAAAHEAHRRGAGEFCIVVAVRGPSPALLDRVVLAVRQIKRELPIEVAVSLGLLRSDEIDRLAEAGVDKVNHNLESSRRYFPKVCTTHTFDERLTTCRLVRERGINLCCGGIIGMGESYEDRVDFLVELQALAPVEVPINFLNPRPGTPFADRSLVEPMDGLTFVALARFALPRALIRFAGGRELTLRGLQDLGMLSGASGIILGNYLTTNGRDDTDDFDMLSRLGFEVTA